MRVMAAINEPGVAQKILRHLGPPTDGPRCASARTARVRVRLFWGTRDAKGALKEVIFDQPTASMLLLASAPRRARAAVRAAR